LPTGLSLNPVTGAITGTPTATGIYNFTITATDNVSCPGSRPYTIVVAAVICPAITLAPATLPTPIVGVAYSQAVTASGGVAPYTYAVSAGALPAGLALNATTGSITGLPTTVGGYSFTINVSDMNGCFTAQSYTGAAVIVPVAPETPVPTLSEWALFALASLMGLMAMKYLRRA
jgi:large repetitive protein